MTLSQALPSEAALLSEIAVAAKRHWGYPESWIHLWRPLLEITPGQIAAGSTFAARERGRVVGFFSLELSADRLRLEHLWVLPSWIGRGVGRALFQRARRVARAMGFTDFEVESDPHAAGFYERMGACRTGIARSRTTGTERELPIFRCPTSPLKPRRVPAP